MKRSAPILIILALSVHICKAQNFEWQGLEIYNPAYVNPAFTGSKRSVQVDITAFDLYYVSATYASAMTSMNELNSSFGLDSLVHIKDRASLMLGILAHEGKIDLMRGFDYSLNIDDPQFILQLRVSI